MKFNELYRNTNGKYSGSGFVGIFAGITAMLSFIAGIVAFFFKFTDALQLMEKSLFLMTIAATLLGVRKISKTDGEFKKD